MGTAEEIKRLGPNEAKSGKPYLVVLGIAQDGGYPAAGCRKACCARAWTDPALRRHVACLGLVNPGSGQRWLLDCTPDFPGQLRMLDQLAPNTKYGQLSGILLTHAHIGHYSGLIYLGREAMNTRALPVYAMERMQKFLEGNGPWSQLIEAGNITLHPLVDEQRLQLSDQLAITPLLVPHRDEYSETLGFIIHGRQCSALYLPDIDKWERWDRQVEEIIAGVDFAFVDGTFFADGELGDRDMTSIAHPFIGESIARLSALPASERSKIKFIHFNHSNPVLDPASKAVDQLRQAGFHLAEEGEQYSL